MIEELYEFREEHEEYFRARFFRCRCKWLCAYSITKRVYLSYWKWICGNLIGCLGRSIISYRLLQLYIWCAWHQETCTVKSIHAICPGRTKKSRNFDPSKPVPTGRYFSRKICFVPESLWPVKCTAFSDFWTGQIAIKTIITRPINPSHVYCIYLTPVQRCGEVFRQ